MTVRVAIYARVSTSNHGQDIGMQTREQHQFADARGWQVFDDYIDHGVSGSKDSRPELNRLMADAHKRRFDVVVRLEIRPLRPIGLSPTAGPGDFPGARHRVCEPVRAARHVYTNREDGVYGPGRRCRTRAQPDRGTGESRTAQRQS